MKSSLSTSEVGAAEDVIQALLDYLVDPLLPLKSSDREVPSLAQQKSVSKQDETNTICREEDSGDFHGWSSRRKSGDRGSRRLEIIRKQNSRGEFVVAEVSSSTIRGRIVIPASEYGTGWKDLANVLNGFGPGGGVKDIRKGGGHLNDAPQGVVNMKPRENVTYLKAASSGSWSSMSCGVQMSGWAGVGWGEKDVVVMPSSCTVIPFLRDRCLVGMLVDWTGAVLKAKELKRWAEVRRIHNGSWKFEVTRLELIFWEDRCGCFVDKNKPETLLVRVLGLPVFLWSEELFRALADRCGGYITMAEETMSRDHVKWARICVRGSGTSISATCRSGWARWCIYDLSGLNLVLEWFTGYALAGLELERGATCSEANISSSSMDEWSSQMSGRIEQVEDGSKEPNEIIDQGDELLTEMHPEDVNKEGVEFDIVALECYQVDPIASAGPEEEGIGCDRLRMWEEMSGVMAVWGTPWVWEGDFNMVRLDRFLVSSEWERDHLDARQYSLPRVVSDHKPVYLVGGGIHRGLAPFRFENMWLQVEGFRDLVREWWEGYEVFGSALHRLAKKLRWLKEDLKRWNKEVFGRVENRLANLMEEL
ncbi:hypothetical protein Acr_02g0009000 [Actinidia rufa]|uniref:DUF7913 domain-containing protein n=1 Tax=Actinidia rufa TaxID=165716 RepID=A0A7J0E8D1_9ERIC|nr:hypothetical protein Acr_02g0009000 [Actinidia rufa]